MIDAESGRGRRRNRGDATNVWILLVVILLLGLGSLIVSSIVAGWLSEFKQNTSMVSSVQDGNVWAPCEKQVTLDYRGGAGT